MGMILMMGIVWMGVWMGVRVGEWEMKRGWCCSPTRQRRRTKTKRTRRRMIAATVVESQEGSRAKEVAAHRPAISLVPVPVPVPVVVPAPTQDFACLLLPIIALPLL
jgi:hypothetical protein